MASSPITITTTTPSSAGRTNSKNEDATATAGGTTAANKTDDNNDDNQTEKKETETDADKQIVIDATTTTTTTTTTNSSSSSSKKRPRSGDTDIDAPIINNNNDDDNNNNNYGSSVATDPALIPLLTDSLYGMLDGIPRTELKLIVSEAKECERALEEELQELKDALRQYQQQQKQQQQEHQTTTATTGNVSRSSVNVMLESEVTPPDHQWTLSALLGRLRHDLTTPLPPNSQLPVIRERTGVQSLVVPKKKRTNNNTNNPGGVAGGGGEGGSGDLSGVTSGRSTPNIVSTEDTQFQRLVQIRTHPDYVVEHDDTDRLLAVWRKVSTHRSSLVFRRPVNPKDAPGYTDKVHFPMDLSLIRKLILHRTIRSYRDFVRYVHLIGHNCVKYNGRESDYALVTREFESYASEYVLAAVHSHRNPLPVSGSGNVGRPSKQSKQQQQQHQQQQTATTTTTTMVRTATTTTPTPTPTSNASLAATAAAAVGFSVSEEPKPEAATGTDKDTGGGPQKGQEQQQQQQQA
jgi:hypothetical protein